MVINTNEITSWDRPKSAPYLRLKKAKGLQNVKVLVNWGPFYGKNCKKSNNGGKNLKGDPLVSSGIVCYAGNFLVQFLGQTCTIWRLIKICGTFGVELFWSLQLYRKNF